MGVKRKQSGRQAKEIVHHVHAFGLEYSAEYRQRRKEVRECSPEAAVVYPFSPARDPMDDNTVPLLDPAKVPKARRQYDYFMSLRDQLLRQFIRYFTGPAPDRWEFIVRNEYA